MVGHHNRNGDHGTPNVRIGAPANRNNVQRDRRIAANY